MFKDSCSIVLKTKKCLKNLVYITNLCLIVLSLTACESQNSENGELSQTTNGENNIVIENDEKIEKIEISMEDAIVLGSEEASKYYDNLQLTEVHSYDNDKSIDETAGNDGKRQWWYVNFANEDENYVSILICDGKIDVVEYFDSNVNNGLLDMTEVTLTAEEAVKKAEKMGLQGGNPNNKKDWVSGFNFKLSYASLVDSPDDIRIFLEVIGISPNGNFAHVDFDAATGEVLLAEEQVEYSNGDIEWKRIEW